MAQKICNDRTGLDKVLHIFCTFVIGCIAAAPLSFIKFPTSIIAAALTFAIALVFGIWKECCDQKQAGNHFCLWDLLWDAAAAIAAAAVAYLANYYTWHDATGILIV